MEKAIYDYKKNKYDVKDNTGTQYWLRSGDKFYIVDLKDVALKPNKGIFNKKIDTNVLYDLENKLHTLSERESWKQWQDIIIESEMDAIDKQTVSYQTAQKEKALAEGFVALDVHTATRSINNDSQKFDIEAEGPGTGKKKFNVQSDFIDITSLSQEEQKQYIHNWINGYNLFYSDQQKATVFADSLYFASREINEMTKGKDKSELSELLTAVLVKSFDRMDYFSGEKVMHAYYFGREIVDYMKQHNIELFSDPRYLGNCNKLKLEYNEIYKRHIAYEEDRFNTLMSDYERKGKNYFDTKEIKLHKADREGQEIEQSILLAEESGILIHADKYTDKTNGKAQYEITVNSLYKYFANEQIVLGKCDAATITHLLGSAQGKAASASDWDDIKIPGLSLGRERANEKTITGVTSFNEKG